MTIGIDLTGDVIRAVAVDVDGVVLSRAATTSSPGKMGTAAREVFKAVAASGDARRAPGVVTRWPGDAIPPDVLAALEEEAGTPPLAVHCGNAIVLGEAWCGAAQGCRDVVAFSVGDHVVAGAMTAGALVNGAHGYALSVAWLALNPVEREDYRRLGSLEAEVAAGGIVRRLVARIKSGDHSTIAAQVDGKLSLVTADMVFAAAGAGDGVSISVIRDTTKYVGMAIANLVAVLDPECVVLGDTLVAHSDKLFNGVRMECGRRLRPLQHEGLRFVLSSLGAEAAAIGAARAAARPVR